MMHSRAVANEVSYVSVHIAIVLVQRCLCLYINQPSCVSAKSIRLSDKCLGAGGHYLTGPIYVCGAEPGDVLEVLPLGPLYDSSDLIACVFTYAALCNIPR